LDISIRIFTFEGYIEHTSIEPHCQKFRENAISNITKHIENEEFNCRSKDGFRGVFSRVRKLTYKILIVIMLRGIKSSIQRELDCFYKEVTGSDFNIREVTKGTFTQARAKLGYEVFIGLNKTVVDTFYNEAPYTVWHHMRLLAVDGTRLVLPKHKSVIEEFGEHSFGPHAASKRSLALASMLYDPLNLLTIDAQIAHYASSEKDLLYKHIEHIKKGDLLLLDRGYPSLALIFLFYAKGIEFCMRMKEDWWLSVKAFKESGQREAIVEFALPKKDREKLLAYPHLYHQKIKCRLIRIDLPDGKVEILCTSLIDMQKYTWEDFEELYHFRWNIEEGYKLFKARIEVENFSGKTALAVKQDFFAKIFMMSLCATLAFPIEERLRQEFEKAKLAAQNQIVESATTDKVSKKSKERKNAKHHQKKINHTNALSMIRNISIGLFMKGIVKEAGS